MKAAVAIVVALFAVGALILVYLVGMYVGARHNFDNRLRKLGLDRASADLFARAVKLIARLSQTTDLDGLLAGDQLSPETRRQATAWLADYRRKVIK